MTTMFADTRESETTTTEGDITSHLDNTNPRDVITLSEFAKIVSIPRSTVYERRSLGKIPPLTPEYVIAQATAALSTTSIAEMAKHMDQSMTLMRLKIRTHRVPAADVAGRLRPIETRYPGPTAKGVEARILGVKTTDTPESIEQRSGHIAKAVLGLTAGITGPGSGGIRKRYKDLVLEAKRVEKNAVRRKLS